MRTGAPRHHRPRRRSGQRIRFCTAADGVNIAYATSGTGPPLVKPANWMTHLEYDWESPVWRHWLRELSRERTLIRYDERGCGLSDRDTDDLSFDAWVRDLETVVDAMGLERFPLFGISQGCAVAITYAVRHPERVTQLVLYGGYAQGVLTRARTPQERDDATMVMRNIPTRLGTRQSHVPPCSSRRRFLPEGTPEQMRWFSELQRVTTSPEIALPPAFGRVDDRRDPARPAGASADARAARDRQCGRAVQPGTQARVAHTRRPLRPARG